MHTSQPDRGRGVRHGIVSIKEWGGAGLIVTPVEIDRDRLAGKIVVVTAFSRELNWLIYELRDSCAPVIDYLTKYHFYPRLGGEANAFLSAYQSPPNSTGLPLAVLDEAAAFVRECE